MVINHNLSALNAQRMMSINSSNASKAMQKLSSGMRINSAADDAAGLAISEKMRGQIRGLDQASANAQDGISMIQTAEGALNETTSILQRMRELSIQSSNDSNNDDDRAAIQKEVAQLKQEIDRIGDTTEFNTTKLIDGSIAAKKVAGTDNAAVIGTAVGKEKAAVALGGVYTAATTALDTLSSSDTNTVTVDGAKIDFKLSTDQISAYKAAAKNETQLGNLVTADINKAIDDYNSKNGTTVAHVTATMDAAHKLNIQSGTTGATSTIGAEKQGAATGLFSLLKFGDNSNAVATVTGLEGVYTAAGAGAVASVQQSDTSTVSVDGTDLKVKWATAGSQTINPGDDMSIVAGKIQTDIKTAVDAYNATVPSDKQLDAVTVTVKDGSFVVQSGSTKTTSSIKFDNSSAASAFGLGNQSSNMQGGGLDFQIGANAGQTMKITIADMRTAALGIDKIDMSTKDGAKAATTLLDAAIKTVSSQRADLGAYQNRLEHTIANLGTSSENLTSAESRIRDVDMAKEMSEYSKNNILSQAAQAMLAQANQQPQQVLQLLR